MPYDTNFIQFFVISDVRKLDLSRITHMHPNANPSYAAKVSHRGFHLIFRIPFLHIP